MTELLERQNGYHGHSYNMGGHIAFSEDLEVTAKLHLPSSVPFSHYNRHPSKIMELLESQRATMPNTATWGPTLPSARTPR